MASTWIGGRSEKGEVRTRMGDRRDNIPDHILGTGQYLDCGKTSIHAEFLLRGEAVSTLREMSSTALDVSTCLAVTSK